MARLVLNLLGTFQALLDGRPVDNFQYDKVRALLAYLAVESDRPHRREKLVGLLWPGYPESSARRNLAQALYNLRNALGDRDSAVPFLLVTPHTIQLNPAADVQVDVEVFQAAVERGGLSHLEEAATTYRGRFLSGLSLDDCPVFDEWVALRREALQGRAVVALQRLARLYEEVGRYRPALQAAHRGVALDPYWEEGQRALMRLLAADGQRNAALAQYEELRELLEAELGVEPELGTTALYDEIRSERGGVALRSVLKRVRRDRRAQLRVMALAVLVALSVAFFVWLRARMSRGPSAWDPTVVIEGVSLWPEIDLRPWATNPILKPGEPGSWDELVLAPTAVESGSWIFLYYAGARDWPNGSMVILQALSQNRTDFGATVLKNPRVVGDGAGFDAWGVGMPVVVLEGNGFRLYYAGAEAGPFSRGLAIGQATAETADSNWRRDPEPIVVPGGPGEWDSCAVVPGSVIVTKEEHRLYYLGSSEEACDRWMVGMASSLDGIQWTKYDNPETEGTPFAESDPVLARDDSNAWDGGNLTGVAVRDTGRGWEMFYSAEGEDGRSAVGYAWSVEGIRWHRNPDNPVLRPEDDPYAADALQVHSVTFDDSTYRLYYDYGLGNGLGVAEGKVKWPIVVNTARDELNSDGDCSLREAIEAANRDAAVDMCPAGRESDRVIVPAGTYVLTLVGGEEDENQTGDLDILDDLALLGAGAEATVLDGDGADRLLHNHGARLELEGLTLTNGREPIATFGGGGLLNHSGSVTVDDCVISRNVASYGGGVANRAAAGATGTMVLNSTLVVSNTAQGNGGGVFQLSERLGVNATVIMTITRSTITGNTAEGSFRPYASGGGGGIISGFNAASDGSAAVLSVIDSTVSDNVAAGVGEFMIGAGGGILISGGEATLINCTVSGNQATGAGEASGTGGGLWISSMFGPVSVRVFNSTVTGNRALSGGGGIAVLSVAHMCGEALDPLGTCDAFLPSSRSGPAVTFHNTIVAANQAPAGAACFARESVLLSGGHNLEDWDSCGFDQVSDLPNTDPLLGPLADNGGPAWTHAPLPGSPAVDAAFCPDLFTDQRGYRRPVDHPQVRDIADGCDIGAVELEAD